MAVIEVCEIWRGRTGSWSEDADRTFIRIFRVRTDNQFTGPLEVMGAGIKGAEGNAIPKMGDPYFDASGTASDFGCLCKSIQPTQTDDPWTWEVVCEYGSDARDPLEDGPPSQPGEDGGGDDGAGGQNSDGGSDPTTEPPTISVSFMNVVEPFDHDVVTNQVIRNSAGFRFDPPMEIERSRMVIRCTWAATFPGYDIAAIYQDTVNSDSVSLGGQELIPPRFGRIRGFTIDSKTHNGQTYYAKSLEIEVRREAWNPIKIVDEGYYQIVANEIHDCVAADGSKVSCPAPLDGTGLQMLPNGGAIPDLEYISATGYLELPYANLGLFDAVEEG